MMPSIFYYIDYANNTKYKDYVHSQSTLTTKWTSSKEGLEDIEGVMTTSTTHSFFKCVLAILIIDLSLLRVAKNLISLSQFFKLQ